MSELDRGEGNGNSYAGKVVVGLLAGAALGAGPRVALCSKAGVPTPSSDWRRGQQTREHHTTYRKASEKAGAGWKTATLFYDKGREATARRGEGAALLKEVPIPHFRTEVPHRLVTVSGERTESPSQRR